VRAILTLVNRTERRVDGLLGRGPRCPHLLPRGIAPL